MGRKNDRSVRQISAIIANSKGSQSAECSRFPVELPDCAKPSGLKQGRGGRQRQQHLQAARNPCQARWRYRIRRAQHRQGPRRQRGHRPQQERFYVKDGCELECHPSSSAPDGELYVDTVIVKTSCKHARTRDLTGSLPRVAELFAAHSTMDEAKFAKIDGIAPSSKSFASKAKGDCHLFPGRYCC